MSARQIITDVIAALELTTRLEHAPLRDDLLVSSRNALEKLLGLIDPQPLPLPPSPPQSEPSVSSTRRSKYTDFIGEIVPVLRRLNPSRNHKINFTDAAKLWKANRHLNDPDEILRAARAQAEAQAEPAGRERSLSFESV
jgi:hypothetical protein